MKRLTGFNEREPTRSVGVKFRFTMLHELARGWISDFASAAVDGIAAHFQQALGPLGHCMTKLSIFVFSLITRWLDSSESRPYSDRRDFAGFFLVLFFLVDVADVGDLMRFWSVDLR